jgi:NAD(P)-dependent dehydrogenase (short-subunit alcohol dehydrogenase family)
VNVRGPFFAVQRAASALRATRGQVLLVGSVDGVKPVPTPVDYGASKAALDGLSRSLSKALGPDGVRVNAVHPGVLTGGLSHALRPGLREDFVKHASLKREGRPEEVAAMIAFMVRENSYVTGQGLVIDGGL